MKLSQVISVLDNFSNNVIHTPFIEEVHFSCDCGCGGDSYTSDEWESLSKVYDATVDEAIVLCDQLGLIYDFNDEDYAEVDSFTGLFWRYEHYVTLDATDVDFAYNRETTIAFIKLLCDNYNCENDLGE